MKTTFAEDLLHEVPFNNRFHSAGYVNMVSGAFEGYKPFLLQTLFVSLGFVFCYLHLRYVITCDRLNLLIFVQLEKIAGELPHATKDKQSPTP